jgi:tRNA dimethylallyltransferase
VSHARLGANDLVRVSRALEVHELTGKALSALQAEHGFREPLRRVRLIGVRRERAELQRRIAERARSMLERGWLDEVRSLLSGPYADARALRSVGYRQIVEALRAGDAPDPAPLAERVAQATNAFARHQMTWLRSQPVEWVVPSEIDAFVRSLQAPATGP